jgi:hypothetical protein
MVAQPDSHRGFGKHKQILALRAKADPNDGKDRIRE